MLSICEPKLKSVEEMAKFRAKNKSICFQNIIYALDFQMLFDEENIQNKLATSIFLFFLV